jgi:hypothetical protein
MVEFMYGWSAGVYGLLLPLTTCFDLFRYWMRCLLLLRRSSLRTLAFEFASSITWDTSMALAMAQMHLSVGTEWLRVAALHVGVLAQAAQFCPDNSPPQTGHLSDALRRYNVQSCTNHLKFPFSDLCASEFRWMGTRLLEVRYDWLSRASHF